MANKFVELGEVSLRYGADESGVLALEGMTLQVERGEFIAVVGPSGCGKSTLMKVVTGLWPPNSGAVIVANKEVYKPLDIVGMAFQNPSLLPWRTTLSNVMLPLEIKKPAGISFRRDKQASMEKARDLLRLVGLDAFENQYPWQLSGGMQQRVSLCRALVHDPSLLMLDEPFGALDMFTREELWAALQNLWMTRLPTVILVTHDLREAVFLADRICVMSNRPGKIIAEYKVPLPRPRTLESTITPQANEIVRQLREHISQAREKSA